MSINYQASEGVATVMLNRPEKRNALDDVTISGLGTSFARAEADPSVRVILLRGAGSDFCAGADLSQLEKIASGGTRAENLADAMTFGNLLIQMRRMRKPLIAAVHGNALAGGAGLATACDLVIADGSAVFGYPEVKLGFVPAMVMALLIRSVGEKIAFQLTALGSTVSAAEAQRLGLVNQILSGDFEQEAAAYARRVARYSPSAVQLIKRLLHEIDGVSFEDAIAKGAEINVEARASADCRDGVRKFLAARRK
jgi:methylglutaconyl-CoA hydratase